MLKKRKSWKNVEISQQKKNENKKGKKGCKKNILIQLSKMQLQKHLMFSIN